MHIALLSICVDMDDAEMPRYKSLQQVLPRCTLAAAVNMYPNRFVHSAQTTERARTQRLTDCVARLLRGLEARFENDDSRFSKTNNCEISAAGLEQSTAPPTFKLLCVRD